MNRIWQYFRVAGALAVKRSDSRSFFLAAIGVRGDGRLVHAQNGSPWKVLMPASHAEARLARKLDVGATVYVARVRIGDGSFGLAKPCARCRRILLAAGVKKVYYTVTDEEFGLWYPR